MAAVYEYLGRKTNGYWELSTAKKFIYIGPYPEDERGVFKKDEEEMKIVNDKKPLRIYIAGPYTAATLARKELNVKKAITVGINLYEKGHYPLIPHLSHFTDLEAKSRGTPLGWSEYMSTDIAWLRFADAMFFIGPSPGADAEYLEAKKLNMKIYYDIAEVPFILHEDRDVIWERNNPYRKDLHLG